MGNMLNLNVEDGGSDQTKHYYQYIDICCKDWICETVEEIFLFTSNCIVPLN
jgi:hypothetical protein